MLSADFIRRLIAWCADAKPEEREAREKTTSDLMLNLGSDEAEVARVEKLIAKSEKKAETKKPDPVAEDAEEEIFDEDELYAGMRLKRATNEEGYGAELAKMQKEARGTPLFTTEDTFSSQPVSASRETIERLKKKLKGGK